MEPESSDEPYLNRANSGQSIVQSVYSTFDPLHGNSTNAAQTRSSSVNPPVPIPTQVYFPLKVDSLIKHLNMIVLDTKCIKFNLSPLNYNMTCMKPCTLR